MKTQCAFHAERFARWARERARGACAAHCRGRSRFYDRHIPTSYWANINTVDYRATQLDAALLMPSWRWNPCNSGVDHVSWAHSLNWLRQVAVERNGHILDWHSNAVGPFGNNGLPEYERHSMCPPQTIYTSTTLAKPLHSVVSYMNNAKGSCVLRLPPVSSISVRLSGIRLCGAVGRGAYGDLPACRRAATNSKELHFARTSSMCPFFLTRRLGARLGTARPNHARMV